MQQSSTCGYIYIHNSNDIEGLKFLKGKDIEGLGLVLYLLFEVHANSGPRASGAALPEHDAGAGIKNDAKT